MDSSLRARLESFFLSRHFRARQIKYLLALFTPRIRCAGAEFRRSNVENALWLPHCPNRNQLDDAGGLARANFPGAFALIHDFYAFLWRIGLAILYSQRFRER
jgi:hypothetical protein